MRNLTDNVNNLVALWKTVGDSFGEYSFKDSISYVSVGNSQWPNRIWFNNAIDKHSISEAIEVISNYKHAMGISYWADFKDPGFELLEKEGLELKSELVGMSLDLSKGDFSSENRLVLDKINSVNQAKIWEEVYPQSFGYIISAQTVISTMDQIDYFLINYQNQVIGTVMTLETNAVVGIHGMGILPSYRKQGFAHEVLLCLLNKAKERKKSRATLQASSMGKRIYKNIGFSEDFLVRNYRPKNVEK